MNAAQLDALIPPTDSSQLEDLLVRLIVSENLRLAAITPEDDRRIRDYIDAHAKRLPRSGALAMLVEQTK